MDPAQRQAAMIMIQSLQAQLVGLMNVLGINAIPTAPNHMPRPQSATAPQEYMSDEEEETIDKELEQVRKDAERETESIQSRWEKQRDLVDKVGTFA